MPRQHTFKTTRDTDWLDDVLDSVPNKSDFIRELVLIGLAVKGINPPSPLAPYGDVLQNVRPVTQNVQPKVTQEIADRPVPEAQTSTINTNLIEDAPEIIEKELSLDDLEARLNSMNFD